MEATTAVTTEATTAATTEPTVPPTTTVPGPTHPEKYQIKAGQALVQVVSEVYRDYHLDADQQAAALQELIKANPEKITNNGNNYYAGDELVIPDIDSIVNNNGSAQPANTTKAN